MLFRGPPSRPFATPTQHESTFPLRVYATFVGGAYI